MLSNDLNLLHKSFDVLRPTLGIPNEYMNEYNGAFLLPSIAFNKLSAFFSPNLSKVNNSSFFIEYKSLKAFISNFSNKASAVFSLNPGTVSYTHLDVYKRQI